MKRIEDGEALFENCAAAELEAVLWKITDAHAAGLLHGAVVEMLEPGEYLHQRGFAGAIGADERGFFLGADEPVGVEEQLARPKALACILK